MYISKTIKRYVFIIFLTIITLLTSNNTILAKTTKKVNTSTSYSKKEKKLEESEIDRNLLLNKIVRNKTTSTEKNKPILPDIDLREVDINCDVKTPHCEKKRNIQETLILIFIVFLFTLFSVAVIIFEIKKSFKNL